MLTRDRILTPIAEAFFAFLTWLDAIRGRAAIGQIGAKELRDLQIKAVQDANQSDGERPVADFLIVNVRSEAEYSVSMIPDAITKAEFEKQRISGRQPTVIPYCTVGGRSYLYARKLVSQGIPTRNFEAGIVGWCNAKLPLVNTAGQPTNQVYISDPDFRVPVEYEVVR